MLEVGNSAARLEPFLLISKSVKGAAAAKLVQDVTSAPGVFVFAELLELPNIQEVCTKRHPTDNYSHKDTSTARFKSPACVLLLLTPAFLVWNI